MTEQSSPRAPAWEQPGGRGAGAGTLQLGHNCVPFPPPRRRAARAGAAALPRARAPPGGRSSGQGARRAEGLGPGDPRHHARGAGRSHVVSSKRNPGVLAPSSLSLSRLRPSRPVPAFPRACSRGGAWASEARWPHLPAGAPLPGLFRAQVTCGPLAARRRVRACRGAAGRPSAGMRAARGRQSPGAGPGKGKALSSLAAGQCRLLNL